MQYSKQLRTPEWKAKRLLIISRDASTCKSCGLPTDTPQVHHLYYLKNKMAWEYPDEALITLCSRCHKELHETDSKRKKEPNDFFMIFTSNINTLLTIRSVVTLKTLLYLYTISEYNTGRVLITAEVRKLMLSTLEISSQQLSNALNELKSFKLISGMHGTYHINSNVAWKGSVYNKDTNSKKI